MGIKEQITTDLPVAGSKIGAAVSIIAATYSSGFNLSDWALSGRKIFALVQTFTVKVKNWGNWSVGLVDREYGQRQAILGVGPADLAAMYRIFDYKRHPFYEHQLAT